MAQLIENLPQLQNRIKREPDTYRDDFLLQLRSFDAQYEIFKLHPSKESKEFCRLIQFLSQVSHLYPGVANYLPKKMIILLLDNHSILDPELRKTLFQSLVLLRNRGQQDPKELIELCFNLFKCEDKNLREALYAHILTDIRNINKKATNIKLNRSIQGVLFNVLEGQSNIAAKKSLQVIVELYKKRIWTDVRTVNVIASACFSRITKNVVVAIQFFLGIDEQIDTIQEEEEAQQNPDVTDAIVEKKVSKSFSKKTRARIRKLEKEVKALKKAKEAKKASAERRRAEAPRFPAIDLINDSQGFVEKLFKNLKGSTEHFEVRLMMMNLITRIIGHHRLIFMPLYSFLQRYIQPHQKHVTQVLAYLIQASHDLIPPEEIEPIVKLVANNFVTDRSGPEVMAVGLNTIRELLVRVPLISDGEGMDDLVSDLIEYRRFRRDRSVVMAARSLLNAIREINPSVLQRKQRGKFHDLDAKPMEYGTSKAADGVEGAELLQLEEEGDDDSAMDASDDETSKSNKKKRKIDQTERIDAKRILSEEDFERIRELKRKADAAKKDPHNRRKVIRYKGGKAVEEENNDSDYEFEDSDDDEAQDPSMFDPTELEGVVKRRRKALAERLERVYAGREQTEVTKNRTGGTSNLEKEKTTKNFLMTMKSRKVRRKQTMSLRQQQHALKKHIKTLEKKKKLVQKVRRRR